MNKLFQLFYLADWFVSARVFGSHKPLQSVVFVSGGCNSTCRHCVSCKVKEDHLKSYDDIVSDFQICYEKGARILDIEGVNLVNWEDGDKGPADIFKAAKRIGFYNTSTMVPAKYWSQWDNLDVNVDVLWISISGVKDLEYLNLEKKASLYMVINSNNYEEVDEIIKYVHSHKNLSQIAFNFHTPFSGSEYLALSKKQRETTIKKLISKKKSGYPIMNTVSGLKNMLSLDFKRYCWVCNFIYCDGRESPICIDDKSSGICEKCGFCMSGEMNAVLSFKLDTILAGLKNRG